MRRHFTWLLVLCIIGLFPIGARAADDKPTVLRTPNGGIQPQAVVDAKGTLHLIYFKGNELEGDLYYVTRAAGKDAFSEPLRVNSQASSAVALGTIRGGQLVLGKGGRVHVAWNGSGKAMPQAPNKSNPMLYARLDDAGKAFEPQRNLMQQSYLLDGGGTVAADDQGNVYVGWHATQVGTPQGEATRQVWVARSTDDGKTFAREKAAMAKTTGACACCGMRGFVDSKGVVHFLYRSVGGGTRDIYMLSSKDQGKSFENALVQKWKVDKCPMSTEAFAEDKTGVIAAWETDGQVQFARMASGASKLDKAVAAPGAGKKRRQPALAGNAKGETLLAWTEDTDWNKGGSLVWQVFDAAGKPTEQKGRVNNGIAVWGLPAAVSTAEGGFLVIH